METYDSILVAVDGSDPAWTAIRQGVELAATFDASLTGVHVVPQSSAPLAAESDGGKPRPDQATEAAIKDFEQAAETMDVPCRTTVERGTPHTEIESASDRVDADLVTIGTHARTGLDRLLAGSVADRTLRTSERPVLVTPHTLGDVPYDSVLIATDGSGPAAAATDHGLALAEQFDATVHALSAVDIQTPSDGHGIIPEVAESVTERHEDRVTAVAQRAAERGLDTATAVPRGTPSTLVTEYVDEHDIDLIAMGAHGRSGLTRYLLGSVAERVVATSPAPVLAVPSRSG